MARREMFVVETQVTALAAMSAKRSREEDAVEDEEVVAPARNVKKKKLDGKASEMSAADKAKHKKDKTRTAMVPDTLQLPLFLEIRVHGLKHYIPTDRLRAPSLWAVLLDVETKSKQRGRGKFELKCAFMGLSHRPRFWLRHDIPVHVRRQALLRWVQRFAHKHQLFPNLSQMGAHNFCHSTGRTLRTGTENWQLASVAVLENGGPTFKKCMDAETQLLRPTAVDDKALDGWIAEYGMQQDFDAAFTAARVYLPLKPCGNDEHGVGNDTSRADVEAVHKEALRRLRQNSALHKLRKVQGKDKDQRAPEPSAQLNLKESVVLDN